MDIINIHDAKTHFSALIRSVLEGEKVVIAKAGKPIVRLIPYTRQIKRRYGGQLKGMIKISEDFDSPLPKDQLELFYGQEGKE